MNLEGKCLEEFNKFYIQWVFNEKTFLSLRFSEEQILNNFKSLHLSEKWGVLQDYFSSVNIFIGVFPMYKNQGRPYVEDLNRSYRLSDYMKMPEARTAAIKKAVEIRNEQLNSK